MSAHGSIPKPPERALEVEQAEPPVDADQVEQVEPRSGADAFAEEFGI